MEHKHIKTDSVCLGEGLSDLFRTMRAQMLENTQADHLICDMNGEPYRADEFGFAVIRAGELFKSPSDFSTPATCWGDVGAATGPLLLILCDVAEKKGIVEDPRLRHLPVPNRENAAVLLQERVMPLNFDTG